MDTTVPPQIFPWHPEPLRAARLAAATEALDLLGRYDDLVDTTSFNTAMAAVAMLGRQGELSFKAFAMVTGLAMAIVLW